MLILSRRKNERIRLVTAHGETIEVVVHRTGQGQIKLGIVADRSVQVTRPTEKEVA